MQREVVVKTSSTSKTEMQPRIFVESAIDF